jgi:hypothetical protein
MGGTDDVAGHAFYTQKFLAGKLDLHPSFLQGFCMGVITFFLGGEGVGGGGGGAGQKYI